MIKISAEFATPDGLDFALGALRRSVVLEQVRVQIHKNYHDGSPYPIKPEYLEPSHTQYLEGMPHVLSNAPIFDEYFEPEHRRSARVEFMTVAPEQRRACDILLRYGGNDIKIEK